jgi:hypothetical protein
VNVEYPDLTDYLAIAAEVTGTDLKTIADATKLDLADSALHAPLAPPLHAPIWNRPDVEDSIA